MRDPLPAPSPSSSGLQLVLVEPAGPLNVGSVARLCANYSIDGLRLVAPRCDPWGEEARRMAVHGQAFLDQAWIVPTLAEALADCRRVVACSGRLEGPPLPLEDPIPALSWLLQGRTHHHASTNPRDANSQIQGCAEVAGASALVFGREDRGLSNDELLQAGRLLTLATDPGYSSLNLSHAVAVVLHQLYALRRGSSTIPFHGAPGLTQAAEPEPCARVELEAALIDAEALLLEVGFLLPHTAHARMAKLRTLLQRAQIRSSEVALLRGMVAQLRWASRRAAGREQPCSE